MLLFSGRRATSQLGGAGRKVPASGHWWSGYWSGNTSSLPRVPEMQKPAYDKHRRSRFHLLLPAVRGDHTKGRVRRQRAALLTMAGAIVTRGQVLEGASSSVLTLCPGDANPFLGLRFIASTAASTRCSPPSTVARAAECCQSNCVARSVLSGTTHPNRDAAVAAFPRSPAWRLRCQRQGIEPSWRINQPLVWLVDGDAEGQSLFGKHHVGERLLYCILLSPLAPRAEEEFAGHDLDVNPDGKAPVDQVGRKPLGRKAFGQLLGADEGSGDPLAVVKHLVCLGVAGLSVQGPEDNRHTHECTEKQDASGQPTLATIGGGIPGYMRRRCPCRR